MTGSSISEPEYLDPIKDLALFYPCCGADLQLPLRLFATTISDFYFVDIRKPRCPRVEDLELSPRPRPRRDVDLFVHRPSGHAVRLHRWQRHAEEVMAEVPKLGVFFFRGDFPVNGEGSSGVLWFGRELFSQVLALLVPGGLVVTDGSNVGPGGPRELGRFHDNPKLGERAVAASSAFQYHGRLFTCVAYVGERYGPTLVWQVA